MNLRSQRICLRPTNESDWPLFREIYTCPEVMTHVYDPYTVEAAKDEFQVRLTPWDRSSGAWLSYTIELADHEEDPRLGFVGLRVINQRANVAEFGMMLRKSAQRKGYGTEAIKLFMAYAFESLNINKASGTCSSHNPVSIHLLEKFGFTLEGKLRENSFVNGVYLDDLLYGLCKKDATYDKGLISNLESQES